METKKTTEANIEKLRVPITLLGLLFTGSIILASFSFTTKIERDSEKMNAENIAVINFLEVAEKPDEIEPSQPDELVPPPAEIIKIDSNKQTIVIAQVIVHPPKPPKDSLIIIPRPPIIDFPDVEAQFNGELQSWIAENVKYPQTAIEMNDQGKVYLSFIVELDGSITDVTVERGVSSELDREAKRLTRIMPKWIPAETNGKKVRTRCRLPINFKLN